MSTFDDQTITIEPPSGETAPVTEASARAGGQFSWLEALKWAVSFPVMLGAFLVGREFYAGRGFLLDPDVWWHIKVGQTILATHHWPTTDPYSFTVHGQPWMAYEWLGEVVTGWIAKMGGIQALHVYLVGLGSAILIALYYLGTLRARNSKAGFLAAGLLSSWAVACFTLRPEMLGFLFLVATLICLEYFRRGKRGALWLLPPIMFLWVNVHGSFIVGIGTIFVYWMCGLVEFRAGGIEAKRWSEKERRDISLVFLLCLAVLPLTPYGTQLAVYPFNMAFAQPLNVANIQEWQSMPFTALGGKVFLAFVLGFFVLQMFFDFELRLDEFVLFVGTAVMTFIHIRFVMIFVPFAVPVFAVMAARWLRPYKRAIDKFALNAVLIAGLVGLMAYYWPSKKYLEERVAEKFPVSAVQYLRAHPVNGPMYDTYFFGGYLVNAGYPTFIDGRADLFERGGVFADYLRISHLQPGGLSLLGEYHVRACLLMRDEPLSVVLAALPNWKRVYSDDVAALYVRTDGQTDRPRS